MNAISIVIRMYSYKVLKRDGEKMLVISLNPNTTPSQVPWTVGKKDSGKMINTPQYLPGKTLNLELNTYLTAL